MNSSLCLVMAMIAAAVMTSCSVQARDSDRDTPIGSLLKSIFTSNRNKPVKAGIVEPSAIVDSSEVGDTRDNKGDLMDLADFLSPGKGKKSRSEATSKRREGFLGSIFRTLTGDRDQDTAASSIDEIDEDTTTKRPSLFRPLFGESNRFASAIRSSARDGWRSFLKRALPALFS